MALTPITNVDESDRTPDRDKAANQILEWLEAGREFNAEALAETFEYSPQHYRNTVDRYFEEVDDPGVGVKELASDYQSESETTNREAVGDGGFTITVPDGVESVSSYLRGYVDALDTQ